MDDVVKVYFNDYKKMIVSFLQKIGTWPHEYQRLQHICTKRATFVILFTLFLLLGILNFTIHNSHNIMLLVACSRALMSFGSSWLKIVTLTLMWQDVAKLNSGLTVLFENDLMVPEYRKHLLTYYPSFYRLFVAYVWSGVGALILNFIIPVQEALHGHYITSNFIRVPFNYTPGGPVYCMIIAFEITAIAIMTTNTLGTDSLFGLYALQMAGQLRLLSHRFRNLKPGQDYKRELKSCIDRHNLLIDYKYLMDKIFGFLCVLHALFCAIILCSLAFQIIRNKNMTFLQIFYSVFIIAMKFLQSYTFACFGNAITLESEKCVESMYYSEWAVSSDLAFKKDVVIIQSQRPFYIEGLGIMFVQMDMFTKIAQASISYYFILKTIENNLY